MAMYVFLFLNGIERDAPEPQVVSVIDSVAAGKTSDRPLPCNAGLCWLAGGLIPMLGVYLAEHAGVTADLREQLQSTLGTAYKVERLGVDGAQAAKIAAANER